MLPEHIVGWTNSEPNLKVIAALTILICRVGKLKSDEATQLFQLVLKKLLEPYQQKIDILRQQQLKKGDTPLLEKEADSSAV